jgi:hypothetical protein
VHLPAPSRFEVLVGDRPAALVEQRREKRLAELCAKALDRLDHAAEKRARMRSEAAEKARLRALHVEERVAAARESAHAKAELVRTRVPDVGANPTLPVSLPRSRNPSAVRSERVRSSSVGGTGAGVVQNQRRAEEVRLKEAERERQVEVRRSLMRAAAATKAHQRAAAVAHRAAQMKEMVAKRADELYKLQELTNERVSGIANRRYMGMGEACVDHLGPDSAWVLICVCVLVLIRVRICVCVLVLVRVFVCVVGCRERHASRCWRSRSDRPPATAPSLPATPRPGPPAPRPSAPLPALQAPTIATRPEVNDPPRPHARTPAQRPQRHARCAGRRQRPPLRSPR